MSVYLPVAEISTNGFLLVVLGVMSGFLSGLFGVGGGFVMTPLLVFAGIPTDIAVGTQSCQLVGTTLSGALAHWQKRQIDIRMGLVVIIGSFTGTFCGVELFKWLKQTGALDLTITLGYFLLLGSIGTMMIYESWRSLKQKPTMLGVTGQEKSAHEPLGANWPFLMDFPASELRISVLAPIGIGFVCGVMVAIFGVGGGFILVPALFYLLRMPVGLVNGTSLFKVIFTTGFTAVLQATMTHSVDAVLAFFLLLGSVGGAQLGARYTERLRPELARFLLAVLLLIVAIKLFYDLVATPHSLFSLTMLFP